MARNVGQTLLRIISILGALAILGIVVLTASTTLMPGTKVRRLFGASPEALANPANTNEVRPKTRSLSAFAADADSEGTSASEKPAATGLDAGTPVTGEQGR